MLLDQDHDQEPETWSRPRSTIPDLPDVLVWIQQQGVLKEPRGSVHSIASLTSLAGDSSLCRHYWPVSIIPLPFFRCRFAVPVSRFRFRTPLPLPLPHALAHRRRWLAGQLRNKGNGKHRTRSYSNGRTVRQLFAVYGCNGTEFSYVIFTDHNFTTAERRNCNGRTATEWWKPGITRVCWCRLSSVADRPFQVVGPWIWNDLPADVTSAESLSTFRQRLKTHLFVKSFPAYLLDIN